METENNFFTPAQQTLFGALSMTTIALWKHSPFVRSTYGNDIGKVHEHLVLHAMNSRWAWDQVYIAAATTIH